MAIGFDDFKNIAEGTGKVIDKRIVLGDDKLKTKGLINRFFSWIFGRAKNRKDRNRTAINKFLDVLEDHYQEHGQTVRGMARKKLADKLKNGEKLTDRDVKKVLARAKSMPKGSPEQIGVRNQLGLLFSKYAMGAFDLKWTQNYHMTMEELASIHAYTTSNKNHGYSPMNRALRTLNPSELKNSPVYPLIHQANSGLKKMPNFEGLVYRHVDLSKESLSQYKVGQEVVELGFTSTSRKKSYAWGGDVGFVIESKHGKKVENMSHHENEQEVLFRPGTKFLVTSKTEDPLTGHVMITMTEVEDEQN